jgi:hypothetical protein
VIQLYLATLLLVGIGIAHSVLGERYVLRRLERLENLPRLTLGGGELMVPVLRFAWHLTSIAWFGIAAILTLMANGKLSYHSAAMVIAVTFIVSALVSGIPSRGRHYSWLVFLAIGIITAYEAVT